MSRHNKTIDEIVAGVMPLPEFNSYAKSAFAGGGGKQVLAALNHAIPPFKSPRCMSDTDDPVTNAYFEGLRDMSAFLFRMSQVGVAPEK